MDALQSTSGDRSSVGSGRGRQVITGVGVRRIKYGGVTVPKAPPSVYSVYVGRVGALAVALGVGAAIASMPAIAFADTTGSGGSTNAISSSSSSGPGSSPVAGGSASGGSAADSTASDSTDETD